ncbi:MAG: PfkB family carbohydrate kinase [Anaeromyxobacteraceae bacterium]
MIALLGNLARDLLPGQAPRVGGGAFHGARALHHLRVPSRVYARCAESDRADLLPPVVRLGTPVVYVPGSATASFVLEYHGEERKMRLEAVGDSWEPADVPPLPDAVRWVHVAPLARSDFPVATLAALARGRRVSLDAQGLVRVPETGELRLDADYDRDILRHVWTLKVSDEEAEVLGDLQSLPVREIVATHGSRGSTVYTGDRVEEVPAYAFEGDPTGAGDAFSVAYIAARSSGFAPAAAARRATAVVAAVLTAA